MKPKINNMPFKNLYLSGIYLCRKSDNDFMFNKIKYFFPDLHANIINITKKEDIISYYYRLINSSQNDRNFVNQALASFDNLESAAVGLIHTNKKYNKLISTQAFDVNNKMIQRSKIFFWYLKK